jgi:hypothetical protein
VGAIFAQYQFSNDFMRDSSLPHLPLSGLFRELSQSVKAFVREELQLARSEMSEKVSCYGRNATSVAIGGAVAYAGLIVLLGGIGILVGWAFRKAHMDPALANFLGLGGVGLVVVLVGAALVLKGIKAFSTNSLAPQRTIDTIKHLKVKENTIDQPRAIPITRGTPVNRPADELKAKVLATEDHINATLGEIAYRASPGRLRVRADTDIRTHPYTWSLAALGGGLVTSLLVVRRLFHR